MVNYPITMNQIETKKDLEDFVKGIPDLREDFHEASDFINARVEGLKLDNEGFNDELSIILMDRNYHTLAKVKLATLLGMANNG